MVNEEGEEENHLEEEYLNEQQRNMIPSEYYPGETYYDLYSSEDKYSKRILRETLKKEVQQENAENAKKYAARPDVKTRRTNYLSRKNLKSQKNVKIDDKPTIINEDGGCINFLLQIVGSILYDLAGDAKINAVMEICTLKADEIKLLCKKTITDSANECENITVPKYLVKLLTIKNSAIPQIEESPFINLKEYKYEPLQILNAIETILSLKGIIAVIK